MVRQPQAQRTRSSPNTRNGDVALMTWSTSTCACAYGLGRESRRLRTPTPVHSTLNQEDGATRGSSPGAEAHLVVDRHPRTRATQRAQDSDPRRPQHQRPDDHAKHHLITELGHDPELLAHRSQHEAELTDLREQGAHLVIDEPGLERDA